MKVGFTGSRTGMDESQREAVYGALLGLYVAGAEFHFGDCIGADAEAALIAETMGYVTVAHPPTDETHRAFYPADVIWPQSGFLERNQDIVDISDKLIATPKEHEEVLRSGTWSTIRKAKKKGIGIHIILRQRKCTK